MMALVSFEAVSKQYLLPTLSAVRNIEIPLLLTQLSARVR